ncbi:MAG TPA: hypothetical protein DD666_00690 [Advenella kashmirensis]|uniref:YdbS-like PH domain-containing protein n=1 Tax=Advenella kashmirensis TaxID=310575 RepID=A0A356LA83_9BURK|nr:hypothetical protein [Advenella kashmirensis]
MASYVDSNLSKGEQVISRAKVSWLAFFPHLVFSIFFILLGLSAANGQAESGAPISGAPMLFGIIGGVLFLSAAVNIHTTELVLTNKRIIAKFGFIRRETVELRLEKVESIGVNQGILGRLFDFGSIVIKGTGGTGTPIPSIAKPLDFRRIVNNHVEEMEEQRGAQLHARVAQ